jgi:hemoglobin
MRQAKRGPTIVSPAGHNQEIEKMYRAFRLSFALTIIAVAVLVNISSASAQDKSLYDRLGGQPAVSAVIDDFVVRVAADTRINQKFARSNVDRVKFLLKEQVCAVTGGPCKYTGRDMKTTHKNMKVTEGEFNALVEDLVASLDQFKVPEKEKSELLGILGPLKDQIVEVNTTATGTPLPADFKPAPPLKMDKTAEKTAEKMKPKM